MLDDLKETNSSVTHWADYRWNMDWQENTSRLHQFITGISPSPPGMNLSRSTWVKLNRLRTGVGLFRSTMYKWGMASTGACECGAEEQTVDHLITTCPMYRYPNGAQGLVQVDENLVAWLSDICPTI